MVLLIGQHPGPVGGVQLAYARPPGDVELLLLVVFPGILIVDVGACGKLLEGDFARSLGYVHGVFLVRFGCLFVSGNLTLKLWHDLCFLASRNVRGNALFARNYRVTKLVNARLSVKIVRKLTFNP